MDLPMFVNILPVSLFSISCLGNLHSQLFYMRIFLFRIRGGELFERVIDDDFVLTEKACTLFLRQICEGLGYMHYEAQVGLS